MEFRSTVELGGKTATGIAVPDEVVEALGGGKRPAVTVTLGGHRYRTTVARMGGWFLVPLSAAHREAGYRPRVDAAVHPGERGHPRVTGRVVQLLRDVRPMAVSSAHVSGQPHASDAVMAREQLGDSVEVYLDGGPSGEPVASTIVDLTADTPRVLREGAVTRAQVAEVLGEAALSG